MTSAGKQALVTGGAGFVGSHIVDSLVAAGASVTVLDSFTTGARANLAAVADRVRVVEADVRDAGAVDAAMAGQAAVFHLAANADVPRASREPEYNFAVNVVGTENVLQAARRHGVERVVFASSAAVYGNPQQPVMAETHRLRPVSPYGASKLAGEALGFAYGDTYGLPFTAMRIFNSCGERQARYVVYDVLQKLARSATELELLGDGTQVRDYVYVGDTARAFVLAAQTPDAAGEAFNVAGGMAVSIAEIVAIILRLLHLEGRTRVHYTGKSWPGDIRILRADIGKARTVLGFHPQTSLADSIARLIAWLQREQGWRLAAM